MAVIRQTAEEYIGGIFRKLREHEYNPDLVKLYVMGRRQLHGEAVR